MKKSNAKKSEQLLNQAAEILINKVDPITLLKWSGERSFEVFSTYEKIGTTLKELRDASFFLQLIQTDIVPELIKSRKISPELMRGVENLVDYSNPECILPDVMASYFLRLREFGYSDSDSLRKDMDVYLALNDVMNLLADVPGHRREEYKVEQSA